MTDKQEKVLDQVLRCFYYGVRIIIALAILCFVYYVYTTTTVVEIILMFLPFSIISFLLFLEGIFGVFKNEDAVYICSTIIKCLLKCLLVFILLCFFYSLFASLLATSLLLILIILATIYRKKGLIKWYGITIKEFLNNPSNKKKIVIAETIILILGLSLSITGYTFYIKNNDLNNYKEIEAKYLRKEKYTEKGLIRTKYVYEYTINDISYEGEVKNTICIEPLPNAIKTIKYNKYNPKEIFLPENNGFKFLLDFGAIIVLATLILLINNCIKEKNKILLNTLAAGVFILGLSFELTYLLTGSIKILSSFSKYNLNFIIPGSILLILTITGIYLMIYPLKEIILRKVTNK